MPDVVISPMRRMLPPLILVMVVPTALMDLALFHTRASRLEFGGVMLALETCINAHILMGATVARFTGTALRLNGWSFAQMRALGARLGRA